MTIKKRICVGAIAGAHGVKGDFKLKSFTSMPEDVAAYGPVETEDGAEVFTLTLLRGTKSGLFVARAVEVKSREQVETLKGTRLYVGRDRLPTPEEDEFYYEDLVGLKAQTTDGQAFGEVKAVLNHGAGDLLELRHIPDVKGSRILPFTKQAVPEIDFAAGTLTVSPPENFLELPSQQEPDI